MTEGGAKPALADARTRVIKSDLDELMGVTPSPWEKLSGASVFITGASGLFGFWVLSSLLKAVESLGISAKATALVRNPEAWLKSAPAFLKSPDLTVVKGDLLTFSFPPGPFTHFIHLAAPSTETQRNDPLATFDVLSAGTRRVLDMALASG